MNPGATVKPDAYPWHDRHHNPCQGAEEQGGGGSGPEAGISRSTPLREREEFLPSGAPGIMPGAGRSPPLAALIFRSVPVGTIVERPERKQSKQHPRGRGYCPTRIQGGEMKILMVEDERKLAGRRAPRHEENSGVTVDAARDGTAGLEAAGATRYDAIVLDVMLPGKDGFQVLEALRGPTIRPRCSCSPPAPAWKTESEGWTWGLTTTSPSPLPSPNSWLGCGPSPAGPGPRSRRCSRCRTSN